MPQLDKLSFISQIFWFSIFFCSFYFLILNKFLVKLFKVLRFRNYILNNFKGDMRDIFIEENLILDSYSSYLATRGRNFRTNLKNFELRFNS